MGKKMPAGFVVATRQRLVEEIRNASANEQGENLKGVEERAAKSDDQGVSIADEAAALLSGALALLEDDPESNQMDIRLLLWIASTRVLTMRDRFDFGANSTSQIEAEERKSCLRNLPQQRSCRP